MEASRFGGTGCGTTAAGCPNPAATKLPAAGCSGPSVSQPAGIAIIMSVMFVIVCSSSSSSSSSSMIMISTFCLLSWGTAAAGWEHVF